MGRPRKLPPTGALARLQEVAEIRSMVNRRFEEALREASKQGASLLQIEDALKTTEDAFSREKVRRELKRLDDQTSRNDPHTEDKGE